MTIRYSVIVPVYLNAASLEATVRRVEEIAGALDGTLEGVFVIDGSPDTSASVLRDALARSTLQHQVVELSRNFGAFAAIRTGLGVARGDLLAVMAADLQEPAELTLEFFARLEHGRTDVVVGHRVGRSDGLLADLISSVYWTVYARVVRSGIPRGGVDVFACTREVGGILARMSEQNTSLIGLLFWVGFRREQVDYVRLKRSDGRSAWTFRKKARYLSDSVYAFTAAPILAIQLLGVIGVLGSLGLGLLTLRAWLMGRITEPGYTPLMLVILMSSSLVLLALGVVGGYVWRVFENGKGRPTTIVMRHDVDGGGADG